MCAALREFFLEVISVTSEYLYLNTNMNVLTGLKNVVEKVKTDHAKPKFHTSDVAFLELYETYTQLGSFESHFNNLVRGIRNFQIMLS